MMSSGKASDDDYDSDEEDHSAVSEPNSLNHDNKSSLHKQGRLPVTGGGGRGKAAATAKSGKRGTGSGDGGQSVQQLSIGPNGNLQYQTPNGIVQVVAAPFNLANSNNNGGTSTDLGSHGTTVIMTHDGQQFVIPLPLGNDQLIKQQQHAGGSMNSNSSSGSGSSSANILSSSNNLSGQQQVMAEEVGRKRETRLLKNREAAKECRRKKKEYIKCLENRVAVLENQNKALIEELKSLKELYCKSTTHD
ncbi:hypothetical protein BV898_03303 [Hypsibius exemplaris]|uniref:BZIP domain-containing protein n=1 Tax=Hypsibius exemplaris TaxID=2072580 RepID=A0A1W0X6B8_HYPEX|nr:hypothetical protein BV898_03303 [Hypsibius exemplaris]